MAKIIKDRMALGYYLDNIRNHNRKIKRHTRSIKRALKVIKRKWGHDYEDVR